MKSKDLLDFLLEVKKVIDYGVDLCQTLPDHNVPDKAVLKMADIMSYTGKTLLVAILVESFPDNIDN